ncbi:staygreen family protein [Peptoniphilus sp. MSJ-1]|uniref:Staygreen family protein n=1 Tax=Peptoniphilus ovalis TaxID=2841503 RepID=A0ABS6FKU4_9FIRM|nr:staygreen family protein [Peptoniphilus ovalis]MBU5669810.1 staygreen family protein [Peptoniphilus ovalis]
MSKINVYEDKDARDLDLKDRKYILAHSDDTGELFLSIVKDFDNFEFSEDKDEVFGYWEDGYFVFKCYLDNENSKYTTEGRFIIFKGHIINSLLMMTKYERKLNLKDLDIPVKEIYYSEDENHNREIIEKQLKEYVLDGYEFVQYKGGFDYKSLKKYKKLHK